MRRAISRIGRISCVRDVGKTSELTVDTPGCAFHDTLDCSAWLTMLISDHQSIPYDLAISDWLRLQVNGASERSQHLLRC